MASLASNLRHMIYIEEPKTQTNDLGEVIETWKELMSVKAEVKAISEKSVYEAFTFIQVVDTSLFKFKIRYIPFLKPSMRIRYKDKLYQIKRIINEAERNKALLIITQELL